MTMLCCIPDSGIPKSNTHQGSTAKLSKGRAEPPAAYQHHPLSPPFAVLAPCACTVSLFPITRDAHPRKYFEPSTLDISDRESDLKSDLMDVINAEAGYYSSVGR